MVGMKAKEDTGPTPELANVSELAMTGLPPLPYMLQIMFSWNSQTVNMYTWVASGESMFMLRSESLKDSPTHI